MDKVETCDYCSNCRTYEMIEEDKWDLNFCYDDEHDLSARSIFISENKQFDIMVVSGAGEPQRLEFRHWNKDAQRWFVYNTIHLKHCINCGREIMEYPEFMEEKDKEIERLKQELEETNAGYDFTYEQSTEAIKELKQNQTQLAIQELENVRKLLLEESKTYPIVYDITDDLVGGAIDKDKIFEIIDNQIKELKGE